jgi:hypothetical protein
VTTISAEGGALARSASAESLAPAMPSGPPAASAAGAPVLRTGARAIAAPAPAGVPAAAPDSAPAPAAAAQPAGTVLIMDTRDTPDQVVSGSGRRQTAVPGGASIVDEHGRRLEIAPQESAPAPPAAPRGKTWGMILGGGALIYFLGFAVL